MRTSRQRLALAIQWTMMLLFGLMSVFWFGTLVYDLGTDHGFQHSRLYEPIMNLARLITPVLFIALGLSHFYFSHEHHELQQERIARRAFLRGLGTRAESPSRHRYFGLFMVTTGLITLALMLSIVLP